MKEKKPSDTAGATVPLTLTPKNWYRLSVAGNLKANAPDLNRGNGTDELFRVAKRPVVLSTDAATTCFNTGTPDGCPKTTPPRCGVVRTLSHSASMRGKNRDVPSLMLIVRVTWPRMFPVTVKVVVNVPARNSNCPLPPGAVKYGWLLKALTPVSSNTALSVT